MTTTDHAARERIRLETAATLFVDAGAGSGKTRSLIDRVSTLVLRDGVPLRKIAAVTFTEKAGAELRDRLRGEFEAVWRTDRDGEQGRRAEQALDDLDGAAIGTLHSFAQRILTLHPVEAGLPPLLEVLDEVASSVAFDNRWAVMQRELLDDEQLSGAVRLAMAAGVRLGHLRSLARAFQSDWDLIADRVPELAALPVEPAPDVSALVHTAVALARRADECTKDDDRFLPKLTALGSWAREYAEATDAESVLVALHTAAGLKWGYGQSASWGGALDELKQSCKEWQQQAAAAELALISSSLRPLATWIAHRVRGAALDRAGEGRLEFHDLLVLARDLLRDDAEVRAHLQRQFPRLLLDEFQDTDPIQIEIAVRIAGGAGATQTEWRDVDVPDGSLFVVGDPKQSIYRFRRADIAMFLRARERFPDTVTLDANFRSGAPVLDWVNTVFDRVLEPAHDAQPAYVPLAATRPGADVGPAVVVLGERAYDDSPTAAEMREREAADVAAVIRQALAEGWTTYDKRAERWRALTLGDVAILVPARTSLPFLEDALDRAAIPYRAESSSLVYQAGEVRDLLAAARAIADPSDLLSCVTALRSPLYGCGDDDLWTWKRDGGSFSVLAPMDSERTGHPVARALMSLADLQRRSRWLTPSEVLSCLVAERRMLEVAASGPRARDSWRRLRFVVDQARAWSETEHGGLRAYLAWAARQGDETSRVAEAVLPETDVDAVRVMTVHAAKGLEFPMVVLSGMSSQPRTGGGVRLLWTERGYAVRLTKTVQTNDFENVAPIDEQMDSYERRRLLYVAVTRARDHLVVSLHRKEGTTERPTNAAILADCGAAEAPHASTLSDTLSDRLATRSAREVAAGQAATASAATAPAGGAPPWEQWHSRIEGVRERSRRSSAVSASGLEGTEPAVVLAADAADLAGRAKGGRDLELPPWSKGRYGTAIGRAVHGVLQVVDLGSGADLDAIVASQCVAESVGEHADVVRGLARSALASDVVRRAAQRQHWRESYVGIVDDDGTVCEGFVDLVYREDDDRLIVVDYKTDAIPTEAIGARTAFYAPQVRAYERALATVNGCAVDTVLLFLHPEVGARASWVA